MEGVSWYATLQERFAQSHAVSLEIVLLPTSQRRASSASVAPSARRRRAATCCSSPQRRGYHRREGIYNLHPMPLRRSRRPLAAAVMGFVACSRSRANRGHDRGSRAEQKPHAGRYGAEHESRAGGVWFGSCVSIAEFRRGGCAEARRAAINNPYAPISRAANLKPGIWGMSIDLKEAGRRIRRRFKKS